MKSYVHKNGEITELAKTLKAYNKLVVMLKDFTETERTIVLKAYIEQNATRLEVQIKEDDK